MSDPKPAAAGVKTAQKDFVILNRYGIHARPAALFVKTVSQFISDVVVEKDGNVAAGKSIMGLLTLEGFQNSTIRVTATGPDADEALEAVGRLIAAKFHED